MTSAQEPKITLEAVLLTEEQIQHRVAELGEAISRKFEHHGRLVVVGVLKGSVVFMVDLLRRITLPCTFDFVQTSSYGDETTSVGDVHLLKDITMPLEGERVLLVDDILDTGYTITYLVKHLQSKGPKSVHTCVLLDKPSRRQVEITPTWVGFTIPDAFVVGYGLDCAEQYRDLPHVVTVRLD
ncbi:MAG: hypoxanthine phosphoribosyltransferase [Nitrospinota bacterium]